MADLKLTVKELGRLRLLLDSEYRRILIEAPEALDQSDAYAASIDRIRNQVIYLQDKEVTK